MKAEFGRQFSSVFPKLMDKNDYNLQAEGTFLKFDM